MKIGLLFATLVMSACSTAAQPPSTRLPAATQGMAIAATTELIATAPKPTRRPITPAPTLAAEPSPVSPDEAVRNITQLFVQWTGEAAGGITLVAVQPVAWPNACLGAPRPEEACAEAAVPGFEMKFDVRGERYQMHTDAAGHRFRVVQAPEPKIGVPIVEWSGGTDAEEGACGHSAIGFEGVAFGACDAPMIGGRFVADERRGVLVDLYDRYAPFKVRTSIGSVAFNGRGPEKADAAIQRQIAQIAKQDHFEAFAGRTLDDFMQVVQWRHINGNGNCEVVTVQTIGEARVRMCESESDYRVILSSEQLTQLYAWYDTFGIFEISSPTHGEATPDKYRFGGRGGMAPSGRDIAVIRGWLGALSQTAADAVRGGFEAGLLEAILARDLALLPHFMSDPFVIAHWQSEGGAIPRAEAIDSLKQMMAHRGDMRVEAYDAAKALAWPSKSDDGARLVKSLRITGWAAENDKAEAALLIYQRPDGSYVWSALVISRDALPVARRSFRRSGYFGR